MWAVTDFTEENGATRIVPGSHRWTDDRTPEFAEIVQADMPAGSVLIYNGSLLHGGGPTIQIGIGVVWHYITLLGWLRQEENQYLAISMEEARAFPEKVQRLMGYDLATVNLGFADHKHPNDILNRTSGDQAGTLEIKMMEADNAVQRFKVSGTDSVGRARIDI